MTAFNRESSPRQVRAENGQLFEEVLDDNGKFALRPVAQATPRAAEINTPAYHINPMMLQVEDPDLYDQAILGHEIVGEELRQRAIEAKQRAIEAQNERAKAAYRLVTSMADVAPAPIRQPEVVSVPEVVVTPPARAVDFRTYPKNHPIRTAAAGEVLDQSVRLDKEKVKRIFLTTRVKRIGAIALAGGLIVGGSAFAVSNLSAESHDAAITNDSNVPPVDPELIPALTTASLVEAFGGCMDENGGGSVMDKATSESETVASWDMGMVGANGGKLKAEFGDTTVVVPKVRLTSEIEYTACVVAANVADVVSLDLTNPDTPIATVYPDKIDPQVRGKVVDVDRGWSSTDFEPKFTSVEELMKAGVEQKAIPADVAANFTAAYNDLPNASAEVLAAEKVTVDTIATDGSVQSEQLKAAIKQKISVSIKEKVKQLAKDNLTTAKDISVQFGTGKLKTLLTKNQPAPKADKFTVAPKSNVKLTLKAEQAK